MKRGGLLHAEQAQHGRNGNETGNERETKVAKGMHGISGKENIQEISADRWRKRVFPGGAA